MAESAIPVDLLNPGQVVACLGIVEAADVLLGDAVGVFDWDNERFRVSANGGEAPVDRVLRFLKGAEIVTRVPAGSGNLGRWRKGWGDAPDPDPPGRPFPFPNPSSPATLPAFLRDGDGEVAVEYWGDATNRDNFKLWAGAGGYPGAALLRDAVGLFRGNIGEYRGDPFGLAAVQTSSFRLDWRRDYIPIDAGFSPNDHRSVSMVGYPVVEVLAAIGLTNARPRRSTKLAYGYGVLGGDEPLDLVFLRAALGAEAAPLPGIPFRRFSMRLGWPGQPNQARCIVHVTEEMAND